VLIGTQLVLLGPPLCVAVVVALTRAVRRVKAEGPRVQEQTLFLLAFALPLLAVCLVGSLFVQVKPNWLMPCYVAGVLLLAPSVPRLLPRGAGEGRVGGRRMPGDGITRGLMFSTLGWTLLIHALAIDEILLYPVPIRSDDTFFGWSELAQDVSDLARAAPGSFVFSADGYKTSAELAFYTRQKVYAGNILGQPALQFDYLGDDLNALRGRDGLFVDSAPSDFTPARAEGLPDELRSHFTSVEQLEPILLRIGPRIVRKFFVYRCRGYLGPHPAPG
jgi:hypothetical protein